MKSLKYILAISAVSFAASSPIEACGPYYPDEPQELRIFRCCSPELTEQWRSGCRFQDYEKEQNCLLWQKITSTSIPYDDIEEVVYTDHSSTLENPSEYYRTSNKFMQWLSQPEHSEDLEYLLVAKEIEELRDYMNDPWYYSYDGDEEHQRLNELIEQCKAYTGKRHAARYALQLVRLYFASGDFESCRFLWESKVSQMPQDIVTDMIASYAGGAYYRAGNRDKAIELYTRSQDIGSLINLKAWDTTEKHSAYTNTHIKELEYIFNRFPDSPLLSVKLQNHIKNRERHVYSYNELCQNYANDPAGLRYMLSGGYWDDEANHVFYSELKQFLHMAVASKKCHQKALLNYSLGYLYFLEREFGKAEAYLSRAEACDATPFLKESIHAFRFLMDARKATNSTAYKQKLLKELQWLDEMMERDVDMSYNYHWQYENKMNWPFYYWQDVARRVLLGEVCPKMTKSGNRVLALQLANYASNRILQLSPYIRVSHTGWDDPDDPENYSTILTFDDYRKDSKEYNRYDYRSQFFDAICKSKAAEAAEYASRIAKPKSDLDRFVNQRSYTDTDYIYDIVGTLYMREMDYENADKWLSKVSKDYQSRMNIDKMGYFKLDPFMYQSDKKHLISDSNDYKLRFAQEMDRLSKVISTETDSNRRAQAKIRYAIGLRNSFGRCWYLTSYGFSIATSTDEDFRDWHWGNSSERYSFKENSLAQAAYRRVDALMKEAVAEFTDPEQAAQAQLEMKNFATVVKKYPSSKAAAYVRSRCDNYHDYAIQKL